MSKYLYQKMLLAEARGEIPDGQAGRLTAATIIESGLRAMARGYYGPAAVSDALKDVRSLSTAQREAEAERIADSLIADCRPMNRALQDAQTTSDFPLALANLRTRVLRPTNSPVVTSDWRNWNTRVRTVPDFKNIRGLRLSIPGDLLPRAEAEDVKYTSWGESEDGYRVGNFERAASYTWEMHLNDEIGLFDSLMEEMGKAALRTEVRVVFQAIYDGLPQVTDPAQAGAASIATLKAVRTAFGTQTATNADGVADDLGRDITDIIFGTDQRDVIAQILAQEFENGSGGARGGTPNVLRGAFTMHFERLWRRVFGPDYVVFDNTVQWLEVAYLSGFQGGPKTYQKLPNVDVFGDEGSFENHTLSVKVGHTLGAKVVDPTGAARIKGS